MTVAFADPPPPTRAPMPPLTSVPAPETTERMKRVRTRDTNIELALRRVMHARGLRWKLASGRDLPGRPDIANKTRKVAIFVDGCFWHACPDHCKLPKSNVEWWREKLIRGAMRDLQVADTLTAAGWLVVRVWERLAGMAEMTGTLAGLTPACKLRTFGAGEQLWGRCDCGLWAWLGTYAGPKGRRVKMAAEWDEHVAAMARVAAESWRTDERPPQ